MCLKQKTFKQYSVIGVQVYNDKLPSIAIYPMNPNLINIDFIFPSKNQIVHEEVLILDEIGLVGALGGSLGLFIGFSFYGYVVQFLDILFDKVINRSGHGSFF